MNWGNFLNIFKSTFTFDAYLDIPGIGCILAAFATNFILWSPAETVRPISTYIMSALAIIYLAVKIRNAILTGKSIKLDNKIKKKNLEE